MTSDLLQKKKRIVEHYLSKKILLSRDVLKRLQTPSEVDKMLAEITPTPVQSVTFGTSNTTHSSLASQTSTPVSQVPSPTIAPTISIAPRIAPAISVATPSTITPSPSSIPETSGRLDETAIQKPNQETSESVDSLSTSEYTPADPNDPYPMFAKKQYAFEKNNYVVKDFVKYFTSRFKALESMLCVRQELINLTSIRRLQTKAEREKVSIIAMVYSKDETKNGNFIFTVEDLTGQYKVLVTKKSPAFATALDTSLDEVIGFSGSLGDKILFANSMINPDVPLLTEIKRAPDEVYAVVVSDIHIGSNLFLPDRWQNFISWLKGEFGGEKEKEIASKVGYVFIVGDIIEGIGIFPGQEKELTLPDIYDQYKEAARYLAQIPQDKKVILQTGNHDACRIAEPQPRIYEDFAEDLYKIPNLSIVTNPCVINIHRKGSFPGFDCLLYHGFSYTHYCDTIASIKSSGLPISDRTGLIMKYLLQRRHLAPQYASTRVLPNPDEDCLVIDKVPDFFFSGHIHKAVVTNYRGVTLICGSCFQSNSAYQEKFGHTPIPGQVPIINLKTRQVRMLEF
jgi:DNA polymerase II small subunit